MMKIDTNKIINWEKIVREHEKYIDINVKPKIEALPKDNRLKQFLIKENLEKIIFGTRSEWDNDIIPQYNEYRKIQEDTLESEILIIFLYKYYLKLI